VRVELEPGRQKTRGLALDDATGGPLEGVEVHSYELFTRGWGSSRKTLTGPDGRYALDRLLGASDSRKVWFKKKGYVTFTLELDHAEPFPPELDTVRMVRRGVIRGVVLDEAGAPAVGFTVHRRRAPRGGKSNPETKTDAEGRFAFEEVAPGSYRLTRLAGEVEVRPGETTEVEISLRADAVAREK
jgi:5-hydroxyisourate hydrolase-like protein (transthyretin family)